MRRKDRDHHGPFLLVRSIEGSKPHICHFKKIMQPAVFCDIITMYICVLLTWEIQNGHNKGNYRRTKRKKPQIL